MTYLSLKTMAVLGLKLKSSESRVQNLCPFLPFRQFDRAHVSKLKVTDSYKLAGWEMMTLEIWAMWHGWNIGRKIHPFVARQSAIVWMSLYLLPAKMPKFVSWSLIPNGITLRDGAFGRRLSLEGSSPMNEICVLIKEARGSFLGLSAM